MYINLTFAWHVRQLSIIYINGVILSVCMILSERVVVAAHVHRYIHVVQFMYIYFKQFQAPGKCTIDSYMYIIVLFQPVFLERTWIKKVRSLVYSKCRIFIQFVCNEKKTVFVKTIGQSVDFGTIYSLSNIPYFE